MRPAPATALLLSIALALWFTSGALGGWESALDQLANGDVPESPTLQGAAIAIAATCAGPGQISVFTSEWSAPDAAAYSSTQDYWVRRSLGSMIFAGGFERFPGLRIAVVEHELAWAPYFLEKMDVTYKELSQTAPYRFKDQVLPSDFFRSQIFCTFQEDKRGLHMLSDMIGTDTMMFGSDYPHAESTWPRSRQFIDDLLAGVDQDVRRKLVCDNVAGLFKFN